jgi:hypothetical protein
MRGGFELVHVTYKVILKWSPMSRRACQAGFLATPGVLELVNEGKLGSCRFGLVASRLRTFHRCQAGYPDFDIGFFSDAGTQRHSGSFARSSSERCSM